MTMPNEVLIALNNDLADILYLFKHETVRK